MTITLRPLAAADLAVMRAWFEDVETRRWLGGPDWPAQALALASPLHRHALLALEAGVPCGMVDFERYPDMRASFAIAINPGLRRRGLGLAVIEAMSAHPAAAGVTEFFAGIEAGNIASARLVLRSGFIAVTDIDADGFRYYARPAPAGPWRLPD